MEGDVKHQARLLISLLAKANNKYLRFTNNMFIPGNTYRRIDLHAEHGGNQQSGISYGKSSKTILIFSGGTGEKNGYKDQWVNEDIFTYTGEGQLNDMKFSKGNLQLKEHVTNGKRVFLFMFVKKGFVKFESEVELFDIDVVDGLDKVGNTRNAIVFFFKRAGTTLPYIAEVIERPILQDDYYIARPNYPNVTERKGLVTSRVGQGAYRKSLLHRWKYQCAITGYSKKEILIASHIVPWKNASDLERLDVHNGIILSPTYDALFDQSLISFENNGKIILSDEITQTEYARIGLTGKERIHNLSKENCKYLEVHRLSNNTFK